MNDYDKIENTEELFNNEGGVYKTCDACGRGYRDHGQTYCPHCGVRLHAETHLESQGDIPDVREVI